MLVDDILLSIFFLIIEYFFTVDHTTLQVLGSTDKDEGWRRIDDS